MRVLLDTCVILDALQNRIPFAENSQKIFLSAASQLFEGFISAKSVTDIYYLVHKTTHSEKETKEILKRIMSLFSVADTYGIDCRKALLSDIHDYEDGVMIETAVRTKMDYIVTRNGKDYTESPVPVLAPDEFLKKILEV